jgi:hypothetical protein
MKLTSIAGNASNNLYATGHYSDSASGQTKTMVQHWNGSTWTALSTPMPGRAQQLFGAFALPGTGNVWAVGAWSVPGISFEYGFLQVPRTLVLSAANG